MTLLEKARDISDIFAKVFIPVFLLLFTHQYTKAIKEKDHELRFVELGIDILSGKTAREDSSLRKWAIETLNKYSEIPFAGPVQERLVADNLKLPQRQNSRESKLNLKDEKFLLSDSLVAVVCEAVNLIRSNSPSPNASLQASLKFRNVIKAIPTRVFSEKDKTLIEQGNKYFNARNFDYAALTYKLVFTEYDDECTN
jgi:hypothetical protein